MCFNGLPGAMFAGLVSTSGSGWSRDGSGGIGVIIGGRGWLSHGTSSVGFQDHVSPREAKLDSEIHDFSVRLATDALSQDWPAVHSLLAPWLQARLDADGVRDFFEQDYLAMLAHAGKSELHYPKLPYVSCNNTALEDLYQKSWRPRPRPIPAEVTPENFKKWVKIQLLCSPEQADELDVDYLTEVWLIVVSHESELRVGYWAHDPYEVAPEGWTRAS